MSKDSILYFIAGTVPTTAEFEKAKSLMGQGPFLEFVSLQNLDLNGPLLENKGVAGAVPAPYKEFTVVDKKPKAVKESE
jgi:hypothetical protein